MQMFDSNLFQNCDFDLSDIELAELLGDYNDNKLNAIDKRLPEN